VPEIEEKLRATEVFEADVPAYFPARTGFCTTWSQWEQNNKGEMMLGVA
jgi:hypothetical protein